jgi:eukaryotic-like serine/threonine-protein kinase
MADKIGRFEILGEIARNDVTCVYKASDPESGQLVALKTITSQLSSEDEAALAQRVMEEAEKTKPLSSHNLALLYGAGEIDGHLCAAMEYVQGKSIATMLAQHEGFSVWDLQDITRQACQGLDHAHSHSVVHYSLEPAKVMVTWDGTVKILGFGTSTMGAFVAQATSKVPEVLRYMSPEQVQGESLDARSNLFSLGAILYEMVTDRKAFGGEDAEQVRQEITVGMPVAPAQINPKMHPGLSEVIMKALSKSPDQRYQSGQDLVNALEKCKESAPKAAPPRQMPQAPARRIEPASAKSATADNAPGLARAAAAAAAPAHAGIRTTPAPGRSNADSAKPDSVKFDPAMMSAAAPPETEAPSPAASPQPQTGEASSNGGKRPSFSEIDELPPLKEVFVAPPPEPEPAPIPEALPPEEPPAAVFKRPTPAVEKPKTPPREVARKAVREIKKTPPKLFLYSIGAAVAIILLVIVTIAFHIHSETAEETAPPAQAATPVAVPVPTPLQAPAAQTQAAPPVEAAVPAPAEDDNDAISVKPRHSRRRERRVARPAPQIIPGQLTVNSTPEGAQVLVDGHHNPTWVTPFNLTGLAPGQHLVSVSKLGYSPETRTIEVGSGSKSFLVVQLGQLSAAASVSSVPPGAHIFIDGRNTGHVTPAQIQVDKPGNHTFLVKKDGYLDGTITANLQAGQTFQYAPVLRALGNADDIKLAGSRFKRLFGGGDNSGMGTVSVKTQPKGAQVAVNRRILDKASPVDFYLDPGTYIIDITLSGYQSIHRVINVDKTGKLTIDETLERQ